METLLRQKVRKYKSFILIYNPIQNINYQHFKSCKNFIQKANLSNTIKTNLLHISILTPNWFTTTHINIKLQ